MKPIRVIVVGTLAGNPYAGMAWMHMQIAAGLQRLGHDVWYFEFTSNWPYDPVRGRKVCDAEHAVPYLKRVAETFGLGDRWAYRSSYSDHNWYGMERAPAEELLATADLVFNVSGGTRLAKEQLQVDRWVYLGTDPVVHEFAYANGDADIRTLLAEHADVVTYGENIGRSDDCPVPPLPKLRAWTRQPVLMDVWETPQPTTRPQFTTVGNWKQVGLDVCFNGQAYRWSKHHEFLRFIDLPARLGSSQPIELAMNLNERTDIDEAYNEVVRAAGIESGDRALLQAHGWQLANAPAFSGDPWKYRDYIRASRGEFTVARDLNVRTRSGWFSERSASYLAAGRPVITQDTGFATVLPTGAGLFPFNTMEEILAAFEAINSDYPRHSRAACEIAREYFAHDRVLPRLLADLGIP